MEKPLLDNEFLLHKMPGKGGWTFAIVPKVISREKGASMWIKVKGRIDDHAFENLSLAPLRDGNLFFPVKAEIRKIIGKQAGDCVKILLFEDFTPFEIPEEIHDCLKLETEAHTKFMALPESRQKEFISWIYSAKKVETKAQRINITIDKVLKGERLYIKESS